MFSASLTHAHHQGSRLDHSEKLVPDAMVQHLRTNRRVDEAAYFCESVDI
jgi:hypothetical protein